MLKNLFVLVALLYMAISVTLAGEAHKSDAEYARQLSIAYDAIKASAEKDTAVQTAVGPLIQKIGELEKSALIAKAAGETKRADKLEAEIKTLRDQAQQLAESYMRTAVSEAEAKAKVADSGEFRVLEREAGYNTGLAESRNDAIKAAERREDASNRLLEKVLGRVLVTPAPAPVPAPAAQPQPASIAPAAAPAPASPAPVAAAANEPAPRPVGNGVYIIGDRPHRLVNGTYILLSGNERFFRSRNGSKEYWNGVDWAVPQPAVLLPARPGAVALPTLGCCSLHHRTECHECGYGVKAGGGVDVNILGILKFRAGGGAGVGGH